MRIEKNKIVFGAVLAVVLLFIVAYSMLVFSGDGEKDNQIKQTLVPDLEQEQEDFKSKLDAVNALKEVRETNVPSIYDDRFLDSLGYYDPDLRSKQKERIVDSIYRQNRNIYSENNYQNFSTEEDEEYPFTAEEDSFMAPEAPVDRISAKELGLEHQLFYSSHPIVIKELSSASKEVNSILVEVDGNQVVKAGYRLRMRLMDNAVINDIVIPKNTSLFGFVTFQPNRALIEIENINHHPVKLKAFDLQDGSEGIYVENSIQAEARREVIDDIIQDIDIPGVPQVSGIKKVFQRSNRNIKVTITNNYKLILKASQR